MALLIESFPVGPLQCNCSIVGCDKTKEAIVIDPGGDVEKILARAKKHGFTVKYLLHTHAHFDHILGSRKMREETGAKICLHEKDKQLYENLKQQCGLFGFAAHEPLPIDQYLNDEEELQIGEHKASVIFTPGHTPGSCCFNVQEKEGVLFAGDTLFHRSIGRTDLWGGSFDDIIKSISTRLLTLEDSTLVIPGHGEETNIWAEKRENPFLQ